jgi:rhodanese-related sulfurtransferase
MKLSCEQVYNIWSTDPDQIQILDLRTRGPEIPGAKRMTLQDLRSLGQSLGQKLGVVAFDNQDLSQIEPIVSSNQNLVLMNNCSRWFELGLPIKGQVQIKEQKEAILMQRDFIFHQLFEAESSTYTYIIADKKTKEAAIIDPVLETVDRDLKLIEELGLNLVYVLETHIHADHITGAGEIRKRRKAKTAVSYQAQVQCVDIALDDGQELKLGDKSIKVIATPGHDYRGQTSSTIALEKKFNPRLNETRSKDEFKKIMSELKLANPKKIHEAVPANLACGVPKDSRALHPQVVDGIPEVTCEDVLLKSKKVRLIDVRRPDEFNGEYGHIEGATLVTLGPELTEFLKNGNRADEMVFVCRSGGRSGAATAESIQLGYKFTANMVGGMIRWTELKQPVVRN